MSGLSGAACIYMIFTPTYIHIIYNICFLNDISMLYILVVIERAAFYVSILPFFWGTMHLEPFFGKLPYSLFSPDFSVCQNKVIWDMNWVIWTLPISGIVGVHDHPSHRGMMVKRRKQRRWVWILFGVDILGCLGRDTG